MITAIPATSNTEDSLVDARFGRAAWIALYNDSDDSWSFVENSINLSAAQGAGIQTAKNVINRDANAMISCNVGPKAFNLLHDSGVKIYLCPQDSSIKDALKALQNNSLDLMDSANKDGHW